MSFIISFNTFWKIVSVSLASIGLVSFVYFDKKIKLDLKMLSDTYEFGSLLESQEQMFLVFVHVRVCMHTSHLHLILFSSVPVDGALNFTFEMSWEPSWVKSHFNVLM